MPLHPQAKAFLENLAAKNAPGWHEMTPDEGRKVFTGLAEFFGEGPQIQSVRDVTVPGGIPIRVYTPTTDGASPALMYFHGGGWVLGDVNTHDVLCRRLAIESSCVVVSVDYRRAPEHKFPVALEDSMAATRYVADHADELGVHANRLAVGGDSAGGNLAAAVALKARDEGGPALRFQLLIYPVVDHRFDTPTYEEFAEGFGLTQVSMIWFWQQYLGSTAEGANAYASPIRAIDLRGLPPAHVITAEYDVLRAECDRYAAALAEADVPTTTRRYDGMIHGFVQMSGVFDLGRQAVSDAAKILKQALSDGY